MDTFFAIFDNANGILRWYGRASNEAAAWAAFRTDLGYEDDIPGVCERAAYHFESGAKAIETVIALRK